MTAAFGIGMFFYGMGAICIGAIIAYYVCLLIQPYAHVKIEPINKIIKHYSHIPNDKLKAKVIDIANYKIKKRVNEKNFNINSLIDLD